MKNHDGLRGLPAEQCVGDMLLRMDPPYQLMGWLMFETGARLSAIQALRVGDVQTAHRRVVVGTEREPRAMAVSAGFMETMTGYRDHLLRPLFERGRRWIQPSMKKSAVRMFAGQLVFPAWMLAGLEKAALDQPVPAGEYVLALQTAARAAGYGGPVHSHTLRLAGAHHWLKNGMAISELHERLGHKDFFTTLLLAQALRYGGLTFAGTAAPPIAAPTCRFQAGVGGPVPVFPQ